jgi:hypothetical protein
LWNGAGAAAVAARDYQVRSSSSSSSYRASYLSFVSTFFITNHRTLPVIPHRYFYRTFSVSTPTRIVTPGILRLGLGSTKWKQCSIGASGSGAVAGTLEPQTATKDLNSKTLYDDVVATALQHGISTIEVGLDGGDAALATAYRRYIAMTVPPTTAAVPKLEILLRVGYRHESNANDENSTAYPDDVILPRENASTNATNSTSTTTIHSLHPTYLRHAVLQSPLLSLKRDFGERIALVVLLHNPETQLAHSKTNSASSASLLHTMLTRAFVELQQFSQEPLLATEPTTESTTESTSNTTLIDGFGVVSNGLSLPSSHPLHLSPTLVLEAAREAYQQTIRDEADFALKVVQFPINALETTGLAAARQFQQALRSNNCAHLSRLQVYGMRPLTCYPDGGTGSTRHAFVLADFVQPISEVSSLSTQPPQTTTAAAAAAVPSAVATSPIVWTNEMSSSPLDYDVALRNALSHFDAPVLMERDPSTLTPVERDTVQGCRLLQGILHDLDEALSRTRSWSTYQEYLYQHVIPTLYDTFDEYDDETAHVLAQFFAAYHVAMQFHVARNTRQLLRHGEHNENRDTSSNAAHVTAAATAAPAAPTYSEDLLPQTKRLQEFGLEFVLSRTVSPLTSNPTEHVDATCNDGSGDQSWFAIDKIILGSSHPDQVRDAVAIVHGFKERFG